MRTVAVREEGIPELVEAIDRHGEHLRDSGQDQQRRKARALHAVREIALERIRTRFADLDAGDDTLLDTLSVQVANREVDPYAAADDLLEALDATRP